MINCIFNKNKMKKIILIIIIFISANVYSQIKPVTFIDSTKKVRQASFAFPLPTKSMSLDTINNYIIDTESFIIKPTGKPIPVKIVGHLINYIDELIGKIDNLI